MYGHKHEKTQFHILENEKSKMVLLWENSNHHIANSMRRVMQTEIPTMAIHIVQVFENSSVIPDEMLVHRLGLLPLNSETVGNFLLAHECPCMSRQCENCSVSIDLHFTCLDAYANVTSRDLMTSNSSVFPVHDSTLPYDLCDGSESILIAKLKRHQQLQIKCVARKGTGLKNAKWSPVVAIVQRKCPVINVDHELERYVKEGNSVYKSMLKHNPINGELELDSKAKQQVNDTQIDFSKNVSLFVIETNGALSPSSVLLQSIQVLKKRVCTLLHELDNMNEEED